jgi:hypothetical protein
MKIQFLISLILAFSIWAYPSKIDTIQTPKGYTRIPIKENSYAQFLRNLELNVEDNTVYLYDGSEKKNQNAQFAVLKMDIGNKDLQQCADAIMRIRAEYLYSIKEFSRIQFNFTNGESVPYIKYAKGYRIQLKGNKIIWSKKEKEDYSYKTFRKYLDLIFTYAGTASLIKELKKVDITDMEIGDIFIQTRSPYGHAVLVIDIAKNKKNEKIFLLLQSYMPAQSIHVLNNFSNKKISPWYKTSKVISTPEWEFYSTDLYRFE